MMKMKAVVAAVLIAGFAAGASARGFTVYDGAAFVPLKGGAVGLDGFGRTAETLRTFGGVVAPLAATREFFFDTWNIDTSAIEPGVYNLNNMTIDAAGSVEFSSVIFSSIDAKGNRSAFVFDINDTGTQAVGSGTFTVLAQCPIASCVWIDVIGTEIPGGPRGYGDGGLTQAVLVPEPATYALMALGLAAVGFAARRRATA